jgi:hypothetical protein
MEANFTALETRQELLDRLVEAISDDAALKELVAYLRDDLAYAPSNRSIVGPVLRDREFEAWQGLMLEAHGQFDRERARDLSGKLLGQMRAT